MLVEEEEGEKWNESHLLPSFSLLRILGFLAHLKIGSKFSHASLRQSG